MRSPHVAERDVDAIDSVCPGAVVLVLGGVAQSAVARYMVRRSYDPPRQSWSTFVRNHAPQIAAMDLFVVPMIGFNLLYALIIVRLAQRERELLWVNVTADLRPNGSRVRLRRLSPATRHHGI
jgi:hypothetical protein